MPSYDPITVTKRCGQCALVKPSSEFNKRRKHGTDPYAGYCRECSRDRYALWVAKNRAHKLAYSKVLRQKNIEQYRLYDKERWSKPEVKKRTRALVRANRHRYSSYGHAYRAKKNSANGRYTIEDVKRLLQAQRAKCAACKKKLLRVHIDHIRPISKGGSNWPHNIQLLCPFCNLSKSNTDPILFMQRRGFLL